MRTTSLTKVVGKLDAIADIRPMVSPAGNGEVRCSVGVRFLYQNSWHNAYADYTGPKEVGQEELCVNAVELAARAFLASKESKMLHSDQQMTCTDEEPITVRPVQRGDVIRLSEVQLNPDRAPFRYKGVECRWFLETTLDKKDLYQWNGIVCRLKPNRDDWTVVDMF